MGEDQELINLLDNDEKEIIEYLKKKPQNPDKVLINRLSENAILNLFKEIDDDFYKTLIMLEIQVKRDNKKFAFDYINDRYCKMKITENAFENEMEKDVSKDTVLDELKKYFSIKQELEKISDETKKAEYICKLQDNDMKISLMDTITDITCRNKIISSLSCIIDEDLKSLAELAQLMMREFIEDTYPDGVPQDIYEKFNIVINRSDVRYVKFSDPNKNGEASYLNNTNSISYRKRLSPQKILGYMIHEYAHLFSNFDFKEAPGKTDFTSEEGNADVWSEKVINTYLQKHSNEKLGFEIDVPYTVDSGYDFENGWVRTLLYPLEKTSEDKKALVEYVLGDKVKYAEMVLGKEYAQNLELNQFGKPENICITYQQLYLAHEESFKDINKSSMYYNRNFILPAFMIQKKVEGRSPLPIYALGNQIFNENFISDSYFNSRKLYEISREEFEEFIEIYFKSQPRNSEHRFIDENAIYSYIDKSCKNISEQDMEYHSLQILNSLLGLLPEKHITDIGVAVQDVMTNCIEKELDNIKSKTPDIERIRKGYYNLYPYANKLFGKFNDGNGEYVREAFKRLEGEMERILVMYNQLTLTPAEKEPVPELR